MPEVIVRTRTALERLSPEESARLARLEGVIRRGLSDWVKVTRSLLEVREARLYRATHPSFEAYCRERWGMTRQMADYRIRALGVVDNVTTAVVTGKAPNERQARELAPLAPAAQRRVWAQANAGGPATLAKVRALAERARGVPTPTLEEVKARSERRAAAAGEVAEDDARRRDRMGKRYLKQLARARRLAGRLGLSRGPSLLAEALAEARAAILPET